MKLRPYQEAAKAAAYDYLQNQDGNPCVEIPTAGGKTPIMAHICRDAAQRNMRVLVLAHKRELLEQTADKLHQVCPEVKFGIYSAGLKRRDTEQSIIVAGIQSVYKRACELDRFDLIIVDEAHLIPTEGEGMYRRFHSEARTVNPKVRVVGFTATPYRLKTGMICEPDNILNDICYSIGVRELIDDGYLCPLISKSGRHQARTDDLHIRGGEFVSVEVEELMDKEELVQSACAEIAEKTTDRGSVLIFAAGIGHAQHVQQMLGNHGLECGFVCGNTRIAERDRLLRQFRDGQLKYLVNVDVLTTGFDATNIDCVSILRPTKSPGLYYQMVGRGFRLHPGKKDCLVLDFGENIPRHGPVDDIRVTTNGRGEGKIAPTKDCPECGASVATASSVCPDCGYEFPPPEREMHEPKATDAEILSEQLPIFNYEVRDVDYTVHTKRGAKPNAPRTMRVNYRLGLDHWVNEFICFEHTGVPRLKAVQWWQQRSADRVPNTAEEAVEIIESGGLAYPEELSIRHSKPYDEIAGYRNSQIPEREEILL